MTVRVVMAVHNAQMDFTHYLLALELCKLSTPDWKNADRGELKEVIALTCTLLGHVPIV